jgi:hypothetical protein
MSLTLFIFSNQSNYFVAVSVSIWIIGLSLILHLLTGRQLSINNYQIILKKHFGSKNILLTYEDVSFYYYDDNKNSMPRIIILYKYNDKIKGASLPAFMSPSKFNEFYNLLLKNNKIITVDNIEIIRNQLT